MTFTETIKRLQLLHELITEEKTDAPEILAEKLSISRASLYLLIDDLKKNNLPITYSRKKKSFIYTKKVNLKLDFTLEIIESEHDLSNINGGTWLFGLPSKYVNGKGVIYLRHICKYKSHAHRL